MVTAGEALRRVLSHLGPLAPSSSEWVPLDAATGRVPHREIRAPIPVPAFPRAAMDGFAVRAGSTNAATTERPVLFAVTAELLAGHRLHSPPGIGAVRIATGAPMPIGMDAVVPSEQAAERATGRARITRPVPPGANVISRGELLAAGAAAVPGGRPLTAAAMGVLAATGLVQVEVHRRPKVILLATGDELQAPGTALGTAATYDANTPMLLAGCRGAGADVRCAGRVADDAATLRAALAAALAAGADLVLTTGGVSVGPADLVPQTWAELGARELFWRVAIKPGKPVYAGVVGRTAVLGLSGSPTACWVAFNLLVAPLLRAWSGWDQPFPRADLLRLKEPLTTHGDALRLLWATADDTAGTVAPCASSPTGTLAAMAAADSLVLQPVGAPPLAAGSLVWALRLDRVGESGSVVNPDLLDRLGRPHAVLSRQPRPLAPSVAVCAFSGDSGQGKTTLIESILTQLRASGEQVAVLKHHGHGIPEDAPGKDGWRLRRAGAQLVAVAGQGGYLLTASSPPGVALDAWVTAMRDEAATQGCHWLLIEGFRAVRVPRVEVLGEAPQTAAYPSPDDGVFLIAAARPMETLGPPGVPVLSRDDVAGILAAMRMHCLRSA